MKGATSISCPPSFKMGTAATYRYETKATIIVYQNPIRANDPLPPSYNFDLYIRRGAHEGQPPPETTLFAGLSDRDEPTLRKLGDRARDLVDVLCKAESFEHQIVQNVSSATDFPEVAESLLNAVKEEFQFYLELWKTDKLYHRDVTIRNRPSMAHVILSVDTKNLMWGQKTIPKSAEGQETAIQTAAGPEPIAPDLPLRLQSIVDQLTKCQGLLKNHQIPEYVAAARALLTEADTLKVDCYIASKVAMQAIDQITEGRNEVNPLLQEFRKYYDDDNDTDKTTLVERYNNDRKYVWDIRDSL